jgi:hypothetical protein
MPTIANKEKAVRYSNPEGATWGLKNLWPSTMGDLVVLLKLSTGYSSGGIVWLYLETSTLTELGCRTESNKAERSGKMLTKQIKARGNFYK